ncbi:hypothetical protein [Niabella soli]|uniref:YARHG domain-containing protein n=1 Tax=Niabella soli DSM 19437 TaxID=929713 RepID=W0F2N8_9BACT|nr:hypothetical protein [Niabella soli]AHF17282.1 hypothetical protein NIASO_05110 [Niabella soli DSM 19437]
MKNLILLFALLFCNNSINAQVPCNGTADNLPGKYTDHTKPKYPFNLKGTVAEKAAMTRQLIALEKLEEASRSNFQLTGCVARVNFTGGDKYVFGSSPHTMSGYQLGVYQNVCHVTEHVVKTVDEYRTVFRVDINHPLTEGTFYGESGVFYITDKNVRYEIAIDAVRGPSYDRDRVNNRSLISQYISEDMVLANRSDERQELKHNDFLKIINGDGYVENGNGRYDKKRGKYYWIDRHYFITRPRTPLLAPVTRKQLLEALLEYYEIEKANFFWSITNKIKDNGKNVGVYEADKAAYQKIYEMKKAKAQQLLAAQKSDWLQQPALVSKYRDSQPNRWNYKESYGLFDFESGSAKSGVFDFNKATKVVPGDKPVMLYEYNPEYFKNSADQPISPLLMEVQFRYEIDPDKGFSERLFSNFVKNYDMNALKKMIE